MNLEGVWILVGKVEFDASVATQKGVPRKVGGQE